MHLGQSTVAQSSAARSQVVTSGDGEVSQGGHDLSGRLFLELAAVLVGKRQPEHSLAA
jgi:hypothetical protein